MLSQIMNCKIHNKGVHDRQLQYRHFCSVGVPVTKQAPLQCLNTQIGLMTFQFSYGSRDHIHDQIQDGEPEVDLPISQSLLRLLSM